jgi:hypothetical protein
LAKRLKKMLPPTERPLVVLAGLPLATSPGVAKWLGERLPNSPRVVFVPGPERDGYLYKPAYVEQCLRAATGYAERVASFAPPEPAPNALILAYVPDHSATILLDAFSFSAFPIPVVGLDEYSLGRQVRHNETESREIALNTIKAAAEPLGVVKRRLNTYSPKDPLFLPPQNFLLAPGVYLSHLFSELRDGTKAWTDAIEVPIMRATHADLPAHAGQHGLNVSIDARELLFPRDLSAHAGVRELNEDEQGVKHRENLLRTLYRFGTPLPGGFHHDVQFARRSLATTEFHCAVKGRFPVNSNYANVYPDDFVRPAM